MSTTATHTSGRQRTSTDGTWQVRQSRGAVGDLAHWLRDEEVSASRQVLDVGLGKDWSSFASMAGVIPLRSLVGDLDPTVCKLHCAVWNGETYPIDVLASSWDDWVGWNSWRGTRDDFNRRFIFSLAQARDNPSHWLFGGVFEVLGRRPAPRALSYDVELRGDLMGAFVKRLMVAFRLPGRAVRLNLETHLDRIEVVSILPQPYAGEPSSARSG